MKRRAVLRGLLVAPWLAWANRVCAQALEIIQLQHRTVEEVLPQVQAFLEPGGVVTGMDGKVFLRTSAANLAQLRRLVAALDVPARRLLLTLSSERGGPNSSGGGTAQSWSTPRDRLQAQVQTIDGGRATLQVGESVLLPMRQVIYGPGGVIVSDSVVPREIGRGFTALPRVSGESVSVDISPLDESWGRTPGSVRSERLSTTVSGRLGEWIALGGSDTAASTNDGAIHYGVRSARGGRQWFLRVDSLP